MKRSLAVLFIIIWGIGESTSQNLAYREIKAPYQNDFVKLELYGQIYEPGVLKDLKLFVSPEGDGNYKEAKTLYLLFPKGDEFNYGNMDSLSRLDIVPVNLGLDDWTAFPVKENLLIDIDWLWLRDARGELIFTVLWDAMGDYGQLISKNLTFKVEAFYDYDDKSVLDRAGLLDVFTDSRDGKEYKVVQIGEMTWMRENLRYDAHFSKKKNDFVAQTDDGLVYSWWNAREACPVGWRLPTASDFMYLKSYYENERHLLPGGVSKLDLESIFYNTQWEYWTSTPDQRGYMTTFKFEWLGLESKTNKTSGSYVEVGDWDKSLIRCVKN